MKFSLRILCVCSVILVHSTRITNSQLDFGDRPRIPQQGQRGGGGGGGQAQGGPPPRGGGGNRPPPPQGAGGGGGGRPPPRPGGAGGAGGGGPPPQGQGPPPRGGGGPRQAGGSGPEVFEVGGASQQGQGPPPRGQGQGPGQGGPGGQAGGGQQGGGPGWGGGAGGGGGGGRGRGLFSSLGGLGGQGPPPPQNMGPQLIPQSICFMKADPGFCNLIIGRWYYDSRYHRCLPFLYTGCGGNVNNFISIRTCEQATSQCIMLNNSPSPHLHAGLTPGALNPINPLSHLAPGFVLGG